MRQYISKNLPDKNGILTIDGKDYRYFRQVLRLKPGDMVNIRLPDSSLFNGTLCKIDEQKKTIAIQLCDVKKSENASDESEGETMPSCNSDFPRIMLFQFIPKSSKMDLIVRQATECGVSEIIPIKGDFSQKFEKDYRNDRLLRIIKEARQQSGSPVETEIKNSMTLDEGLEYWIGISSKTKIGLVLYERNEKSLCLHEALSFSECVASQNALNAENACPPQNASANPLVALVVGAEGGISPTEIEKLNKSGFKTVHFDTNILRCETAALYGIAAIQCLLTEKNKWQKKELNS